jgi:hypothetical protein
MGLDIANALFGNFHLNWAGTMWFQNWCSESGLPYPFIGWESGFNDGDQCLLKSDNEETRLAKDWCQALEQKFPDLARLGAELTAHPPEDLWTYLYPLRGSEPSHSLSKDEWERRAVAAWYAILRHGITHGDTLEYW